MLQIPAAPRSRWDCQRESELIFDSPMLFDNACNFFSSKCANKSSFQRHRRWDRRRTFDCCHVAAVKPTNEVLGFQSSAWISRSCLANRTSDQSEKLRHWPGEPLVQAEQRPPHLPSDWPLFLAQLLTQSASKSARVFHLCFCNNNKKI